MDSHFMRGVMDAMKPADRLVPPTPPPTRKIGWLGETKESKQEALDWQNYMQGRQLGRVIRDINK